MSTQGSAKSHHFCSISADGSVDGSPAQRAPQESFTHTKQKRDAERERDSGGSQSPSSSSFTPLVYKLFLFAAGKHDEWKKTWNQEECRRDEKWMPTVDAECRRSKTCNEKNVSRTDGRKRFLFIRLWLDDVILIFSARLTVVCSSVGLVYRLNPGINPDVNKIMLIPYQSYFTFWWYYGWYPIDPVCSSHNILTFNWSGCCTNYYRYSYTWVSQAYILDINSGYKLHT